MSALHPPSPQDIASANPQGKARVRISKGGSSKSSKGGHATGESTSVREKRLFFKLIVRKLPAKGFTENNFVECVKNLCNALKIDESAVSVDSFTEGFLSRAHGPQPGFGVLCVQNEEAMKTVYCIFSYPNVLLIHTHAWTTVLIPRQQILTNCPAGTPFIADDAELHQPDILFAGYQKVFKTSGRADKLANTYEADPTYLKFVEESNAPPPPKQLLELKDDPIADELKRKKLIYDAKNVPLLAYLKEKAEKQMIEKRKLKLLNAASGKKGSGKSDNKRGSGKADSKGSGKADSRGSGKGKADEWQVVRENGTRSSSSSNNNNKAASTETSADGHVVKARKERHKGRSSGDRGRGEGASPDSNPTPKIGEPMAGAVKLMKRGTSGQV